MVLITPRALTLTRDDSVGGSDGRDDPLDDPLGQTPSHSLNVVLLGTSPGGIKEPLNVLGIIIVELLVCSTPSALVSSTPRRRGRREGNEPLKTLGHSKMLAHSMQCSGSRGVLAMVQMGKAVGGVSMSREHS